MFRRSGLKFLTCVFSVPTVRLLLYGMPTPLTFEFLRPFLMMGTYLGVFHILLRPVLRLLSIPIGCLVLLFSGTMIDIALIYLSARMIPDLPYPPVSYVVITCFFINIICSMLERFDQ